MTNEQIFSMCERSFSPKVTMDQLMSGSTSVKEFMGWGIDPRISVLTNDEDESVGMILKMENERYSDLVMITLSWDDTYRIRFFNQDFEMLKDVEGIYCDQLFEVIDNTMNSIVKVEFCMN